MLKNIKIVVFDWAGTIVDHGCKAPVAAFIKAFARNGIDVSETVVRARMGLKKRDHAREILFSKAVRYQWKEKYSHDPSEHDLETVYREAENEMLGCITKTYDGHRSSGKPLLSVDAGASGDDHDALAASLQCSLALSPVRDTLD